MAANKIPPAQREYRERGLTRQQVREGVDTLTRQIGHALVSSYLSMNDPSRCIYTGISLAHPRLQVIYPVHGHAWSNNRAVAEGVVAACRRRGYTALVIEPKYHSENAVGWSDVGFAIEVPAGLRITMS